MLDFARVCDRFASWAIGFEGLNTMVTSCVPGARSFLNPLRSVAPVSPGALG